MSASSPLLLAHLKRKRIAHTYLFSGPEESAKRELAIRWAQALNCEREKFLEACGCTSCRKISEGNHPDVRRLGGDEKSRSIRIEAVRELIHQASLKPFEGRWKVFIFEGAERLTPDAANALLKTFEEPPEESVFVLLVENKSHLLETIQSRAFEVRVPPAGREDYRRNPAFQRLEKEGWGGFLAALQGVKWPELSEWLEGLAYYLRDRSAAEGKQSPERSRELLEALETVYETEEALSANVNQKLALTHLEIQMKGIFNA